MLDEHLARLANHVFDVYQRSAPREASEDPGVVLVDIDEASIGQVGQWPWPRDVMAQMLDYLGQMSPAVVAYDIAFAEPDRTSLLLVADRLAERNIQLELPDAPEALDNDLAFAAVMARNRVVLGVALSNEATQALPQHMAGVSFAGPDPRLYLQSYLGGVGNVPALSEAASGVGNFAFPPARDNIIRAMPLMSSLGDQLYPGLAVEALRVALGLPGFVLRSGEVRGGEGLDAVQLGALVLPSEPDGRLRVHFSGMPNMRVIPAADLLDESAVTRLRNAVEDRVVIIGTSAIGLRDIVATPLAAAVPGMMVHAEVIDQIMAQSFLLRPDWATGAETLAALVAGAILLLVLLNSGPLISVGAFALLAAGCVWGSLSAYRGYGLLLDPVLPVLALMAVFLVTIPVLLVQGNRERRFVRRAFGQYLSPTLVERLSDSPDALRLGGETRDITVLFSDIRGFTTLSENLGPDALTDLLNSFLTPMTDVLLRNEATIDKYLGDAIMAFWNAPLDIADHPRKACLAALQMAAAVEALNQSRGSKIRIGIGLHEGPACVGNLGSQQRFSYSAIGDSVNLASRIEGLTKQYGQTVLISGAVQQAVPEMASLLIDRVRVVGRAEPVALYALIGDAQEAQQPSFQAYAQQHERFMRRWQQGDFAAAQGLIEHLLPRAPAQMQSVYRIYADRLAQLILNPPDAWDGIHTATSK